MSNSQHKRIVLIGCTGNSLRLSQNSWIISCVQIGHGKGTFGNFLYNLGQTSPDQPALPFGESARLKPDTQDPYSLLLPIQNSPNASEERKKKKFHILDTPGLNDIGREKDLEHMISVLRMIAEKFQAVNQLVLVYRFRTRVDAAVGPALRYYRDLFAPLFRQQNVMLVLTHVSSDDYELYMEKNTWDEHVQTHLNQCNELLQLNEPQWNCPIVRCYFVNSKWSSNKIQKLLKGIAAGAEFEPTDLLYRSYLMREQIIDYISQASEVFLDTHLIPLPPNLENERVNALNVIDRRMSELFKAVRVEDEARSKKLQEVQQLHTDVTKLQEYIDISTEKVNMLSAILRTPSKYCSGDDWIRFFSAGVYSIDAPCNSKSECGGCECRFKYESHNASHSSGYPRIVDRTWSVKINPDFFCFSKKEQRYWYYRFWLEHNGNQHNAAAIAKERKEIEENKNRKKEISTREQQATQDVNNSNAKSAEHNKNLSKFREDKSCLERTHFKISDITAVLHCMEDNIKRN